ncbi:MAG: hypothetical protein DRP09_13100 [Candidatus Thorarchaeota archaeon]|nr:MAG: hypothetical protein DRP09_13100 [Candidatus Thorarchaeota archaeon]
MGQEYNELKTSDLFLINGLEVCKSIDSKEGKEKGFFVEGYICTKELDRQGDVLLPDAVDLEEVKNLTVFYNHVYDLKNAVGKVVKAWKDDRGIKARVFVSSIEKELQTKIQEGIIDSFSIRAKILDEEVVPSTVAVEKGYISEVTKEFPFIRVIKKVKVVEVSLTGIPANPTAEVDLVAVVKALGGLTKGGKNMAELEKKEVREEEIKKGEEVVKEEETTEQKEVVKEDTESTSEEQAASKEVVKEEVQQEAASEEEAELSEEEIKDLVDAAAGDKKPYYYYYYGKSVKEALDKLGKTLAEVSSKLDKVLSKLEAKAAKSDEVKEKEDKKEDVTDLHKALEQNRGEKVSQVNTEEKLDVTKSEDPDTLFYNFIKKNLK